MIKRNTDEYSLKAYCDIKNSLDTARKEGITEGMAKEKTKIAKYLSSPKYV